MTDRPHKLDEPSLLLALSSEQRDLRASDLARLEQLGVKLVVEESPDTALDFVERTRPQLIIVGMTVGMMEGLEFLATLLKRLPDFTGKVVVLPDKGDPFPPVLQGRDPVTRKTTTESIDFPRIEKLVEALAQRKDGPSTYDTALVLAPSDTLGVAAPGGLPAPTPGGSQAIPESAPREVASRTRVPILVAAGLVAVGVLGGGTALLSRSTSPPAASTTKSAEPPTSASSVVQSASIPSADSLGMMPAATGGPSLEQLTTLPLIFARSSADFEVRNADELEVDISALQRGLRNGAKVEIGGHTSGEGSDQFNRDLSQRRAYTVKRYLVSRGVPEASIVVKAYQASAANAAAPEANRRVTVRLIR
jgi:outer membrane protein OmpA-like peptidoglycan-associated protein/DNA-binding NarL/FixJ family response regulator